MSCINTAAGHLLAAGSLLLVGLLTACVGAGPALNSEMIAAKFGSYGIEVVSQSDRRRVANLYTGTKTGKVTRTLAVVLYPQTVAAPLLQSHQRILSGESLGATLVADGWQVEKTTLGFRSLAATPRLAGMMQVPLNTKLAVHFYALWARRDEVSVAYVQIAEVHHPDHLTDQDLHRLYGEAQPAGHPAPPIPPGSAALLWSVLNDELSQARQLPKEVSCAASMLENCHAPVVSQAKQ